MRSLMSKKDRPKSDFEKLRETWYKKLKESGFEDAENDDYNLKIWSSRFSIRHADASLWQAKEEYYRYAEQFLNEHKFTNSLDKNIWMYHANGVSVRDISDILKKAKIADLSKSAIWNIISSLEGAMKRKYLVRKAKPDEQ
jgi:hypothetical protein